MWEGVRRCVGGVEVFGRGEVCGRGGSVWKGWRNVVGGVRCVMGGVEVCGRGEVCVCVCGRGEVCVCVCVCVWKGWRCVEGVRCMGGGSMSVLL